MKNSNILSELNGSVWTASYMDNQTECFEVRTKAQKPDQNAVCLYHREYSIGTAVADFLTVNLDAWDAQLEDLQACVGAINAGRDIEADFDRIFEIAQYWLSQSGIFTEFAASLFKIYPDYQAGKELTLHDCHRQMKYFRDLQPRLRELAEEFFATDNQQDMRALYFNRQAKRGFGTYPILLFGRLQLRGAIRTPDGFFIQNSLSEQENAGGENIIVTEVMETGSSWELVDFILYRYLTENLRFRTCKYCGRYFGVVGNPKTEYCDRLIEGSTKTCKETGSFRLYTKHKMENPAVREYKRSYKAHNARIRYGLMTREQFNDWSREARERRDRCVAGELPLDEFVAWLDSDRL